MSRCFDVVDAGRSVTDAAGSEFFNLEAARAEVLTTLSRLAQDELPGGNVSDFAITVEDQARRPPAAGGAGDLSRTPKPDAAAQRSPAAIARRRG